MEFGKLANREGLDKINWDLPADSQVSLQFLNALKPSKTSPTQFYIGAPMWGPKDWLGLIYPKGTKATDFLYHYSRNYNCIELNTTHYRIPTPEQARFWTSQVPKDFLFCPKVLQTISHENLNDMNLLNAWWNFLENIQANLGPCFLQFHPSFSYQNRGLLHEFLKKWPQDFPLALEFRHPSWFAGHEILPALTKYLQEKQVGLVVTDVAGRRDVLHTSISCDYSMLRFIGNDLHPSDVKRSQHWAARLHTWAQMGLKKVFVFVHEPSDVAVLKMTEQFITQLNQIAQAQLSPLHWCSFLDSPTMGFSDGLLDKSEKQLDKPAGIEST